MRSFYRMQTGRTDAVGVAALFVLIAFIYSFVIHVRQDFSLEKLIILLVIVVLGAAVGFLTTLQYDKDRDGKHCIRMKMYLDAGGMICRDKEQTVWSCGWNEIHHLQKGRGAHKYLCVFVFLGEEEKKTFYFEYSTPAREALLAVCPREDLLDQIR